MEKTISKKVLIITERYFPEKFLINDLATFWNRSGIRVHIVTQIPSYPQDELYKGYPNKTASTLEDGIHVTRFKTVLGYKTSVVRKIANYALFMFRALRYAMREARNADSVFVYHTGPLTQALAVVFIKLFFSTRVVIWTQDVWPDTVFAYGFKNRGAFAVALKAFVTTIYAYCDVICVSSPGFVNRIAPYIGPRKTAIFIPQWVPDQFMLDATVDLDFSSKAKKFIFTGNIGTMQNLFNVADAFGNFEPGEVMCYILGDGSMRAKLQAYIASKKIRNVVLLGSVEQKKVRSCIRQCDFSILPLIDSPLINLTVPAKFQSYLAAGKPILAVTNGEVKNLVETEKIGFCADPNDVLAIRNTIATMVQASAEELEAMSQNMANLLDRQYSKNDIVNRLTDLVLPA